MATKVSKAKRDRLNTPPSKSDRWYAKTKDSGLVKVSTFVAERDRVAVREFGKELREKYLKEVEEDNLRLNNDHRKQR